jgi:hypothetical protein
MSLHSTNKPVSNDAILYLPEGQSINLPVKPVVIDRFRCPGKVIHMKNQFLAVLAVGLLAGPMVAQAQAEYDFQLIDHPEGLRTQVFGVNDRGDAVGNGNTDTQGYPFVYASKKGTFTDLATAAGYVWTAVLGITDSGVMVGSVTSLDQLTEHGLIRSRNGTYTVFSHPDAATFTSARAVNNQGLVTGYRDTLAGGGGFGDGPAVGFIYDPKTGTFTDIDTIPSYFTIAHGINSKGDVVGSSWFFDEDAPCPGSQDEWVRYGWLRTADGSISYFDINGWNDTSARGINDAGWIVGFVYDPNDDKFKGFKVKLDGSPCQSVTVADSDLLLFPGFDDLYPEGITNSGDIVGNVEVEEDGNSHGFIATPR